MSTTQPDANESIEPRTERALTEYMTVTPDLGRARGADGLALVTTQSESTYLVDYDAGRCECPDAEYNLSDGEVCKHVLRARFAVGETPVPAAAAAQLSVDGTLGDATDATVRFTAADGGVVPAADDAELVDDGAGDVWDGPHTEFDRYGQPTGHDYVRCRACGVEVLADRREAATHAGDCPHRDA
jgi:hypothetical protein